MRKIFFLLKIIRNNVDFELKKFQFCLNLEKLIKIPKTLKIRKIEFGTQIGKSFWEKFFD